MIFETFATVKVLEKYNKYKTHKEGYNDDNGGNSSGGVLIVFLVVRPQGIFGEPVMDRP